MKRHPKAPDANTCMTTTELAAWFRVTPRSIERWGVPSIAPGRFLFAHVLEWCAEQKAKRAA